MTPQELAARLNGRQYREEVTRTEEAEIKEAGLVVAFGASDDLLEFRGAISDEAGAWDGTTVLVTPDGMFNECSAGDDCPFMEQFKKLAREVKAVWCPNGNAGPSWLITTDIPHETFEIMEDGEVFCIGVVFRLADAGPAEK